MGVTDEFRAADDNSESEDNDYHHYLPGEMLHTDYELETRLLTWPEAVPFREWHVRGTKQPTMSADGVLPVPVNLEGKARTLNVEGQKAEKRHEPVEILPSHSEKLPACTDEMTREPSSGGPSCSGWKENSAVANTEDEVISEDRGNNFPNVRRVSIEHSQNAPDVSRQEGETLPVQLSKSESSSTPKISQSFSDRSQNEEYLVNEPFEEVSRDRTSEGLAGKASEGGAASPVIMGEGESDTNPRRSQRHRNQPDRLRYGQLGNPLLPIVQSLFQGLNLALADAPQSPSYADVSHVLSRLRHGHMGVMGHTHL
ncbi:uncharacterized protein LOC129603226 [Betta splendens]|uniref:Uncharacterized protein LOC129603226 n=1 Tax=Betta splendens TaxID=158456 RepID=A0A9W2XC20_BETSP|nr:uncharacterized protein LOC129603226 [Betta splendens]XP_055359458.1 uncharacterized protein LOC129603226 [Betta splendens]